MLIMIQIANVALPNWIGFRTSAGFPFVNLGAGAIAVVTIILVLVSGNFRLRRGGILLALFTGTVCYALFEPVSLNQVIHAPWFVEPKIFPWGFEVQPELVIEFLLVLIPAGMGSLALYQTVAEWGGETLTPVRMSQGIFGVALGSIVAGIFGGFITIVYPDNIGMLRATRVGSRFATLAAGIVLIVLGGCVKFDFLLVIVPLPVISAAATLLFGIVFMHSIHILSKVNWDERHLITGGMAFLVGLGGMFVSPDVMNAMPLMLRLILQQPVVSGGVTLIILHALLCRNAEAKPAH
jgi:xanthine/uracil permease